MLVLTAPERARAQAAPPPNTVRLEYVRSPGAERCPEEQGFRDAIGAQIARPLFAPDAAARLRVTLARRVWGYEATAELSDVPGATGWRRPFQRVASCWSLIEGIAFYVAVMLEPHHPPPPSPPPPPPPPPSPPPSSTRRLFGLDDEVLPLPPEEPAPAGPPIFPPIEEAAPPPVQLPEPARRAPTVFRAGAGAWLHFGTAPRPALGLSVDLGLRVAWFSLAAELHWDPVASGVVGDHDALVTQRLSGALASCVHYAWAFVCVLGEAGQIQGGGSGVPLYLNNEEPGFGALGGRLGVEKQIYKGLWLRGNVDLLGVISPAQLQVHFQEQWRMGSTAGGVGAGLFASF